MKNKLVLASRWKRLGGALIDASITLLITLPIVSAMGVFQNALSGSQTTFTQQAIMIALSLGILTLLHGYLLYKNGQTIGKFVVKTRIVNMDGDEPNVGRILALRYYLIAIVTLIPVVGNLIGIVDSLFVFRKDHRCIHDLIAGTQVVNA